MAGGGGLMTLPFLKAWTGQGPEAIATNKIVGSFGASLAFFVYMNKSGPKAFRWAEAFFFSASILLGSWMGSGLTQKISPLIFKGLLVVTCPLILLLVLKRSVWLKPHLGSSPHVKSRNFPLLFATGLASGIYDGAWGPGGGTFMLISLYTINGWGLLESLAASKLANIVSATTALVHFLWIEKTQGVYLVHGQKGIILGVSMGIGATLGARLATQKLESAVRPALAFIAILLLGVTLLT